MRVLFGISADHSRVVEVVWKDDDGVKSRVMFDDGSVKDKDINTCRSLKDAMVELGGPYSPMRPTEVDDLRVAFKYLGKATDLVDTLPEADLTHEPDGATA